LNSPPGPLSWKERGSNFLILKRLLPLFFLRKGGRGDEFNLKFSLLFEQPLLTKWLSDFKGKDPPLNPLQGGDFDSQSVIIFQEQIPIPLMGRGQGWVCDFYFSISTEN
jgi:hypothetical protein